MSTPVKLKFIHIAKNDNVTPVPFDSNGDGIQESFKIFVDGKHKYTSIYDTDNSGNAVVKEYLANGGYLGKTISYENEQGLVETEEVFGADNKLKGLYYNSDSDTNFEKYYTFDRLTGKVKSEATDTDDNGVYEVTDFYDRYGRIYKKAIDTNQNKLAETFEFFLFNGEKIATRTFNEATRVLKSSLVYQGGLPVRAEEYQEDGSTLDSKTLFENGRTSERIEYQKDGFTPASVLKVEYQDNIAYSFDDSNADGMIDEVTKTIKSDDNTEVTYFKAFNNVMGHEISSIDDVKKWLKTDSDANLFDSKQITVNDDKGNILYNKLDNENDGVYDWQTDYIYEKDELKDVKSYAINK